MELNQLEWIVDNNILRKEEKKVVYYKIVDFIKFAVENNKLGNTNEKRVLSQHVLVLFSD
jgi:hypothetical protein